MVDITKEMIFLGNPFPGKSFSYEILFSEKYIFQIQLIYHGTIFSLRNHLSKTIVRREKLTSQDPLGNMNGMKRIICHVSRVRASMHAMYAAAFSLSLTP